MLFVSGLQAKQLALVADAWDHVQQELCTLRCSLFGILPFYMTSDLIPDMMADADMGWFEA